LYTLSPGTLYQNGDNQKERREGSPNYKKQCRSQRERNINLNLPPVNSPAPIYHGQSNMVPLILESTVRPGAVIHETPVSEETMEQYMMRVHNRVDALEHRELLRAAITAPFWWDELSRDLQKQVVNLSVAISSGRVRDFNEVFEYPIEHSFWTEEVLYNMVVSRAA
jgi:hypothetical protein